MTIPEGYNSTNEHHYYVCLTCGALVMQDHTLGGTDGPALHTEWHSQLGTLSAGVDQDVTKKKIPPPGPMEESICELLEVMNWNQQAQYTGLHQELRRLRTNRFTWCRPEIPGFEIKPEGITTAGGPS